MVTFIVALTLLAAGPNTCNGGCSLAPIVIAELPVEHAQLVASSPTSDVSESVVKRVSGRRNARVVARLERRIARKHRA
jgi:hypothetical protein